MQKSAAAVRLCAPVPDLGALLALEAPEERRRFVASHPELVSREIIERLAEDVRHALRKSYQEGLRIGDAALAIAEELGEPESLALALRASANALWYSGQCRRAVELFDQAAELFAEAGALNDLGRTLSSSIQPLILLGEYGRAQRNSERARSIFACQGDSLRLARLEVNVANIHHRQERFAEALAAYERAYLELRALGDEGAGGALHNMAVCLISLNRFDRAFDVYEEAKAFFEQNQMPLLTSQAEYNIAYLHYLRGDYERAMDGLRTARESCTRNGDPYHAGLCELDLSDVYLELNLTRDAADAATSAVASFERMGIGCERARALTNMAVAASRREDREGAADLFARARDAYARESHKGGESTVDLCLAVLLFEAGDHVRARQLCERANEFFRSSSLSRRAALCELLLSRLALAEGDADAARDWSEAALRTLEGLEAPVLKHYAHLQAGRLAETKGDYVRAFQAYDAARRHLETLRSSLQGEDLRIAFMKNRLEVYERLTGLHLKRGLTGPSAAAALAYVEQAKCRSLVDAIFGRARPLSTPGDADDRETAMFRDLRAELNWCYHHIELAQLDPEGVPAERLAKLWEEARVCEDALLRAVREAPGDPPAARVGQESALTVQEIQSALNEDVTLLEYFQIGDEYLAAVLTRTGVEIVPLSTEQTIRRELRLLQLQLSKFLLGSSYLDKVGTALVAAANRHLQDLYRQVLAPVRSLLRGRHVVFSPHGLLHYVPFHALFDGSEYLIDRFTVSYAPSAGIFALCKGRPARASGRPLIMGVQHPTTPCVLREVLKVAASVANPRLLLGRDASVQALKDWGPESSQIHIATHGVFRSDNPLFSSVRMADGHLSLYDLYHLRLPVDLLTLSGCGTGLNVVAAGDEILGLARGLLYAGARTLLLTLWDVHDQSTAEFMQSFYAHLDASHPQRALAHQAATLRVRGDRPHPFHWAPFVLLGNAP